MNKALVLTVFTLLSGLLLANDRSITPTPKSETWWVNYHRQMRALPKDNVKVVFLGDSITDFWRTHGSNVWNRVFAGEPYNGLNLGISADRTEHVLWRLDDGVLKGCHPKALVLMIGTNNTGHFKPEEESPDDTARGVKLILNRLHEQLPETTIILCPIFPRDDPGSSNRARNTEVNRRIQTFCDGEHVLWCDFTPAFLNKKGELNPAVFPDKLHPRELGYEQWAAGVLPMIQAAMEK